MDKCINCGVEGWVEILERGIPATAGPDGLPTYIELKAVCLNCGAESRWFIAHRDDSGPAAQEARNYMKMSFKDRLEESINMLTCKCGSKPVEFVEDISYHGSPIYEHRVRCPKCGRYTTGCSYRIQAQYEWNRWVLTGVSGPVSNLSKDDKRAFIINFLIGEVQNLREQVRDYKEMLGDYFIGDAFDGE